jgi:hypothetical protein
MFYGKNDFDKLALGRGADVYRIYFSGWEYSATFQKMDMREVFPRKAYLLVSRFSFPRPVRAPSRIIAE